MLEQMKNAASNPTVGRAFEWLIKVILLPLATTVIVSFMQGQGIPMAPPPPIAMNGGTLNAPSSEVPGLPGALGGLGMIAREQGERARRAPVRPASAPLAPDNESSKAVPIAAGAAVLVAALLHSPLRRKVVQ